MDDWYEVLTRHGESFGLLSLLAALRTRRKRSFVHFHAFASNMIFAEAQLALEAGELAQFVARQTCENYVGVIESV